MLPPTRLSRRTLLQSAATSALAFGAFGCTSDTGDDAPSPTGTATSGGTSSVEPEDPDVTLLEAAIDSEAALLALCLGIGREHRDLRPVVRPIATMQREHVRRLRDSLTEPPTISVQRTRVPASSRGAVAVLSRHVAAAEEARLADCLASSAGLLARLLASVSASHAVTVERLRAVR